jgi:GTP-binding protein
VVFDWEPAMVTGTELLSGPRGSDPRVDPLRRRTNQERRRDYRDLMDAKTRARAELWTEREQGRWTDPGDE